jgi:hypothetical protein
MPGKACTVAGTGEPDAVVRFRSAPELFMLLYVLALKSMSSRALTSCEPELLKSSEMDRIDPPKVEAVKAPQATATALPLIW